jgi:hypothetical protein
MAAIGLPVGVTGWSCVQSLVVTAPAGADAMTVAVPTKLMIAVARTVVRSLSTDRMVPFLIVIV